MHVEGMDSGAHGCKMPAHHSVRIPNNQAVVDDHILLYTHCVVTMEDSRKSCTSVA